MPRNLTTRRLSAIPVLLAMVATLFPLVTMTAAAAAGRTPDTPRFGRAIEPYSGYEANTVCNPVNTPGANKLARMIRKTYGQDEVIGISRNACYTTSEHNDGRALDWMIDASRPAQKAKANDFLKWLLATDKHGNRHAMARRLGVMYIIFNRKMWRSYDPGWSSYSGTNPHTDHIHISLGYDGSSGRSSFWTGNALTGSCYPQSLTTGAPRVVTDPMRYVPVTPTRLASTDSGAGLGSPCRLYASSSYSQRRVDVDVTRGGAVPGTGVAAVALQVSMRKPNWDSFLTAGPAGGAIPKVRRISALQNKTSSSMMVLPVGADDKVSFFTNLGATDLAVSVVGYYVDPDAPASVRHRIAEDGGDQYDPVDARRLYTNVDLPDGRRFKAVVAGKSGTDNDSTAAVVSVNVAKGKGGGNLYVYPAGADRPKAPLMTYGAGGQTVQTAIRLGRDGAFIVENLGSRRSVDLDVQGAYEPAPLGGGRNYAARKTPRAVVDTANNLGLRALAPGTIKDFSVRDAVTRGTAAVMLQVTVRRPASDAALTFWRPGSQFPGTRDLTIGRGNVVSGVVVAPVSDKRTVRVRNLGGKGLDLDVAVLGSFR